MQRESILVGIDRDGADRKFMGASKNTDGNLASVGGEKSSDRWHKINRRSRESEGTETATRKLGRMSAIEVEVYRVSGPLFSALGSFQPEMAG
jgi:hypothetical protein